MSPVQLPCVLCGNDRVGEVRISLIRWLEVDSRFSVTAAPRCTDRLACRSRVERAGGTWDVADAPAREVAR